MIKIKNMITGEQSNCSKEQLQDLLSKNN
jgi:hypothetical protein